MVKNYYKQLLQLLVVDDDQMNIEVIQAMLKMLKTPSDSALHGSFAIDMIEAKIALYEEGTADMYKIIILDYSMPDMDGPQVAMKITELFVGKLLL